MKNKFVLLTLLTLGLSACSSYYRESVGQYNLPVNNIGKSSKEGRSCYHKGALKFWNSDVDFTIDTARRNGGITNITSIEKEISGNFLLQKKCLIVRGN